MAFACVSIDIDTTWCYREIHGLKSVETDRIDAIYKIAVPRMLGFFASCDIPCTLFVIGKDAEKRGQQILLREAVALGNELANHSYAHDYNLRKKPKHEIRDDIRRAHDLIQALSDDAIVGFRTPGYNLSGSILSVLSELSYGYDSSIFPCPPYYTAKLGVMAWLKLRGRPSRSGIALPQTLTAPIRPYRPSPHAFWRRALNETKLPMEIPICVVPGVRFPIIGTSLNLIKSAGFNALFGSLKKAHPDLLNLEFHAIDFVDSTDLNDPDLVRAQPDLKIPWAQKRETFKRIFSKVSSEYRFATLREAIGV